MLELHTQGGIPFNLPIDVVALINLGLIGSLLFNYFTKKTIPEKQLGLLKHLSGLAIALGAFGTLTGLFQAFSALEQIKEGLPFSVISGGLRVALINILYGLIVYMISMIAFIGFKMAKPATT